MPARCRANLRIPTTKQSNRTHEPADRAQSPPATSLPIPAPTWTSPRRLPDLPPVEAPSAGFVVQLFVIPAVVVLVVIVVWLLFGKLAGGERDAMEYVRQLRLPSANWRSAFELASLIQNDPTIATDPKLLGELTDLLSRELDRYEDPKLRDDPKLAQVRGPHARRLPDPGRPDAERPGRRSARAADAGAGAQVRHRDPDGGGRPAWPSRPPGSTASSTTRAPSRHSARRPPTATRSSARLSVYALGFFGGQAADQILRDRIRSDEDRFVRYNAAVALARRGDPAAESTLREMLSAADLDKVIEIPSATEKQNKIEAIQLGAIEALRAAIRNGSPQLATSLRPELEKLTTSGLVSVRSQALETLRSWAGQSAAKASANRGVGDDRPCKKFKPATGRLYSSVSIATFAKNRRSLTSSVFLHLRLATRHSPPRDMARSLPWTAHRRRKAINSSLSAQGDLALRVILRFGARVCENGRCYTPFDVSLRECHLLFGCRARSLEYRDTGGRCPDL